jgi:hypothetical protein
MNKDIFKPLIFEEIPTNIPYKKMKESKNIHIGQRKLLMNEIYFLTRYGDLSSEIVYAGAAGGHHIPFLSKLFPKHHFYLWDPAPFAIKAEKNINIYNDYFTDDTALSYKDKSVLFISDIRSGNDEMNFREFENEVHKNNQMQAKWIHLMNPKISMLKFRVPYATANSNAYEYLGGIVEVQPWAPPFSGETRLITDGKSLHTYKDYESKMHYLNTVIRPFTKYKSIFNEEISFDYSYELYIWSLYAKKFSHNSDWIINTMNDVSKFLHREIKKDLYIRE